jgi:hypothetical protein
MCNNDGSFHEMDCRVFDIRFGNERPAFDFRTLLHWQNMRERDPCQQDTEQYDPFKKTCRTSFIATKGKSKLTQVRAFKPGRSRRIFQGEKKSSARLPSEGK